MRYLKMKYMLIMYLYLKEKIAKKSIKSTKNSYKYYK